MTRQTAHVVRSTCSLMLALCLAATGAAQQTRNLLPNASFEQGDARGPAGWQTRPAPGSTSRFEWAEGVAHTGERSLLIESTTEYVVADRWRAGYERDLGLIPGTEATLSAWVRTDGAAGVAHVQLYAIGMGGEILAQPAGGHLTGTSDWTRISVTMTAPGEPCYIMPYLGLRGAGKAWFDDVELVGERGPGLPGDMDETTYEPRHFEELDGYEVARRGERTVLQTVAEEQRGIAAVTFYEATARWDVTLRYLDEPDGASTLRVLVNGAEVGSVVADAVEGETDAAEEVRELTLAGVDIQRYSRITVVGEADQGERARIVGLHFAPVGALRGGAAARGPAPPAEQPARLPEPPRAPRGEPDAGASRGAA